LIDTHCHLLPAVDDGPASETDAIELARRLSEQGVRRVVCTPHVSRRFRPEAAKVSARRDELEATLQALEIPLELDTAGELSGGFALAADAEALRPWLLGERHVLVEVVRDTRPEFFERVTSKLERDGLAPVLAHPERAAALWRDATPLDAARAAGALVQVVAPSLGGSIGSDVHRTAWELVESGTADIVASDAHRAGGALTLAGVLGLLHDRVGADAVRRLTVEGPGRALAS
jgi:protein-tyrosine phosphatase